VGYRSTQISNPPCVLIPFRAGTGTDTVPEGIVMTRAHTLYSMCRNGNRLFGRSEHGASGTASVQPRRKLRRPCQPMSSVFEAGYMAASLSTFPNLRIRLNPLCRNESRP